MTLQRGMPVKKCLMCQGNRHIDCEHHINDGAVDASEFVNTKCECPCEGDVHSAGGLIGLVGDLRRQIAGMEAHGVQLRLARQERDEARRKNWVAFARRLDALLVPDDEGNLGITRASQRDLAALVASWGVVREEQP